MGVTIDANNVKITNFDLSFLVDDKNRDIDSIKNEPFAQKTTSKKSFGFILDKTLWLKTDITSIGA